jgi:hypothetical protein
MPQDIITVLGLGADNDDEAIAGEMLAGKVLFTEDKLNRLAKYKGLTVDEFIKANKTLEGYCDPVTTARLDIAKRILQKGFGRKMAAELTGLPLKTIKKLKKNI